MKNSKKLRLGAYILIAKGSSIAIDRLLRGCFVCGLLPEHKGLKVGGICCTECGKRS